MLSTKHNSKVNRFLIVRL